MCGSMSISLRNALSTILLPQLIFVSLDLLLTRLLADDESLRKGKQRERHK